MTENRCLSETAESYYGIEEFVQETNKFSSEGLDPGRCTTDSDFEEMSKEKGTLSKMIKEHLNMSRYNYTVRNLTIYCTLLLQYIGGKI